MNTQSLFPEIFSKLSDREIKAFGLFLQSPYFNNQPAMVKLYQYLCDRRNTKTSPTATEAHALLWPDKPYNDSRFRSATSDLHTLLEQFLVTESVLQEDAAIKIRLMELYRVRKAEKNFNATLRKTKQLRVKNPNRHAEFYADEHQLEWSLYRHMAADKRTEALNLQQVSDALDLAFITQKLRLICLAVSHQSVYTTTYDKGLFEPLLQHIQEKNLILVPAIGLYYYVYRFLTAPDDDASFETFIQRLHGHADMFPHEELRSFYLLAINHGIQHINKGKTGWAEQIFQLYQAALSRDLLVEDGVLSRFAFNNIVAVGLRTGQTAWTEQFIHQYKPLLDRRYREVTFSMNMARVAYEKKDFDTALTHLQKSDYKDLINNFIVKILQIKIYYELGSFDLLESHLDSMQNYMRRKAAIGYHRESYRLVIQYARRLMVLQHRPRPERDQLKLAIQAEKGLIEKAWFLSQLE